MAYIYLFIVSIVETGFAIDLKYSEKVTRLWPTLVMAAAEALNSHSSSS
jgi:multidrug transporter EmrE-like cation transporter